MQSKGVSVAQSFPSPIYPVFDDVESRILQLWETPAQRQSNSTYSAAYIKDPISF